MRLAGKDLIEIFTDPCLRDSHFKLLIPLPKSHQKVAACIFLLHDTFQSRFHPNAISHNLINHLCVYSARVLSLPEEIKMMLCVFKRPLGYLWRSRRMKGGGGDTEDRGSWSSG